MRKYTERLNVTLPVASKERLRVSARRQGISISELIRRRVRQFMDFDDEMAMDAEP